MSAAYSSQLVSLPKPLIYQFSYPGVSFRLMEAVTVTEIDCGRKPKYPEPKSFIDSH